MKDSCAKVLSYLSRNRGYHSVIELIQQCYMTDIRKRISELIAAGHNIVKRREGRFVFYKLVR